MSAVLPRLCAVAMMLGFTSAALAAQLQLVDESADTNTPAASRVSLGWKPSPDTRVQGYSICWGVSPGGTTNRLEIGRATSATLGGLESNVTYYFCIIAHAGTDQTSEPSNEIAYRPPPEARAPDPSRLLLELAQPEGPDADSAAVRLSFRADAGETYSLQASEDLRQWNTLVTTNGGPGGLVVFELADRTYYPKRFYRLVRE